MPCGTVVVALVQGPLSNSLWHVSLALPLMLLLLLISPVIAHSNAGVRADPCPPVPLRFSAPPHIPAPV